MLFRKFFFPLFVLALALSGLVFSSAQATTPKQILVLGDSIVGQSSNYIDFYMDAGGKAQTTIKSIGGTAICDILPDSGRPWTLDGLLAEKRYDAVIMAYSGNSLTKCMEAHRSTGQMVVEKYRADARIVMKIAAQYGVPKVVWVKPPAAKAAGLDYVRTGVGRVYVDLGVYYASARVLDGGAGVENQGRWTRYLPCASWDKPGCYAGWVPINDVDGVHFYCANPRSIYGIYLPCDTYSAGSNRYGMNLAGARSFIGL